MLDKFLIKSVSVGTAISKTTVGGEVMALTIGWFVLIFMEAGVDYSASPQGETKMTGWVI